MGEFLTPERVIDQFNLKDDSGFSCASNALVNGVRINLNQGPNSPFPEMYSYDDKKIVHAYLVWNNVVLNGGVTASPGMFPDLPLDFLRTYAENSTENWLKYTLEAFEGGRDFAANRRHMEIVFPGESLIKAVECLRQGYTNIISSSVLRPRFSL